MKVLDETELRDIIEGCTVLGTGGGGNPEEGWRMIKKVLKQGKEFKLVGLDEISPTGIVPMPYFVGSISEKRVKSVYPQGEAVRSYELLEEYMGKEFEGVISTELGGANTAAALVTAAMLKRPIVDGDPAGRAVPELQHTTYYILGIQMTPFSVVTPSGDEIIVPKVKDDVQAEKIVRGIVAATETNVGVTSHPIKGETLRSSVVPNTLTRALKIGKALRTAREKEGNVIKALVEAGTGFLLFKGAAVKSTWQDENGFTVGEFELEGIEEFKGQFYKVFFKNENLVSWRNEEVDVTIPDLISVLTPEGHPVTNPNIKEGREYMVVGFPAPKIWRTPKGLEAFGPRYVGLDVEYIPIEKKHQSFLRR